MDSLKIAEKIKTLRIEQGITQEAFADKIGMGASAYAKVEQGITQITIDRLTQFAKALNVGLHELLDLQTTHYYVCFEKDFGKTNDEFGGVITWRVYEYLNLESALERKNKLNESSIINPNTERFVVIGSPKRITKANKNTFKIY